MQEERPTSSRVTVDGKHLSLEGAPFRVRGVTYGTFGARADGALYPEPERVASDFAAIAAAGLNTVRTYTLPPPDVLDAARDAGLRVLVGLHYDDWRSEAAPGRAANRRVLAAGQRAVAEAVAACAGRPEVLAFSIGNEVPGDVVRVHGIRAVERVLSKLVREVHAADPDLLATYTSFPTTEYLRIEGQDFVSFNVFLERPEQLRPYLRHLHTLAGATPLVITELGLASAVHGEQAQAESLEWQLRAVDEAGCAGTVVFSWTDEWTVGGQDVEGWGFGLTDAERRPRPALDVVSAWARSSICDLREQWPRISVVVCAHNEDGTLERCLRSLQACDYPDLEVIVCNDGSTDDTDAVARRFPFRVLDLPRGGLSAARNAGAAAATGEIIAFLDADACCHPEWPYHLSLSLEPQHIAATGGPNLPVREAGFVERAVAASPGGPVEVLIGDDRAEHVPGCNLAVKQDALSAIGGFDPVFTAAGDDVDVCWKLLDRGRTIAFAAPAQVRHRRRATVGDYLRQQRGYGRAERLLSGRHPQRFNRLGQARWTGFIYGGVRVFRSVLRPRVYHGAMGTAPFQPVVRPTTELVLPALAAYLPLTLPLALLGLLAPLSAWWLLAPVLVVAVLVGAVLLLAISIRPGRDEPRPIAFRLLVATLHVLQPFARAAGRFRGRRPEPLGPPVRWLGDRAWWLGVLQRELVALGCRVKPGGPHDAWDLEAWIGPFVRYRVTTAVTWGWTPVERSSPRPRGALVAAAVVAIALTATTGWPGIVGLGLLAAATAVELRIVRNRIRRALAHTTSEASTNGGHELIAVLKPRQAAARLQPAPMNDGVIGAPREE